MSSDKRLAFDLDDLEAEIIKVPGISSDSLEGHGMTEVGASVPNPPVPVCSCCCCW